MAEPGDIAQAARYPSLHGARVLVTGGATGIGAAIVEHFCRQRAEVVFVDIADAPAAALAARLAAHTPTYVHADVTDIAGFQAAIAAHGPFSVLVNNAAHDDRHDWREVTQEYWDERIAVNLRHQFFAIQSVAPAMIEAGCGSIVNFGSISWRVGVGRLPAYVASKAAIEGLTRSFARDLGPHRIRVNCVLPGWVMTERQMRLWLNAETEAHLERMQCLPDRVHPADLARMVLFLAAEDSRMITSQTFTVDAGWS